MSANVYNDFPDLLKITKSFIFLTAPCAFLYVRNLLFPNSPFKQYDLFHFIPFIIYLFLTSIVWVGQYTDVLFVDNLSLTIKNPFSILSLSVWLIYAFCQTMTVLNYNVNKWEGNHLQKLKKLGWIRIYNMMVLFLFSALFVRFVVSRRAEFIDYSSYILISAILVVVVGLVYFKPQIFFNQCKVEPSAVTNAGILKYNETKDEKPVAAGSKEISNEKKDTYLEQLDFALSSKKLFLKTDLVIRDISDETGITVNTLSSLINSEFNLNFSDYINLKRIEYFKEKMNDAEWNDLSIEGMSWASGFKTRSTCFRAFRRHTGKSPSEYLKENKGGFVNHQIAE